MRIGRIAATVFVASSLSIVSAAAQILANGTVRGYVKDEQNAVLPGVTITAESPDAPRSYTAVTDSEGYYRLLDVPPGIYTLRAELQGFAGTVRAGISVRAGLNVLVDLTMNVGAISETVEVKAETPLLESRSSAQATNVSGDLQREVPLSGRKHWADAMLVAPGVVSQEAPDNTQYFFVRGAGANSTTFQIDGADATSSISGLPQYISLSAEAIQDVAVKTGSIDPSTPLGLGAAMNVTTKEGTNRLRGAASFTGRARGWNGNNVPGGTAAKITFIQPDVALGGPIVRDRAWFFGSYRRVEASTGLSRTPTQIANVQALVPGFTPFDLENSGNLYLVKSSMALAPRHRLAVSYQRDPAGSDSANSDAAAASRQILGGNGTALRVQSVWHASFLTEGAVSYNDRGFLTQPDNADQPLRDVFQSTTLSGGRVVGVGRVGRYGASRPSTSVGGGEKLTISVDARIFKRGWSGAHEFQAGLLLQPTLAQRLALDYVNGGAALEERVLLDPQDPSKGTRVFRTQTYDNAHQQSSNLAGSDNAFYLQDNWNPTPSLTANVGLRVDVVRRADRLFDVPTQRSREIGPRVGMTYTFTDDGLNVARLSWSRVHETMAQNWISVGSSAAGFTDRYDVNGDGVLDTTVVTAASTRRNSALSIDVDRYHQPRADQWNAGFRRQFAGRMTVDVGFTHRELKGGTAFLETNAIYEGGLFRGYRNESLPQSIFRVTNNRWNWQVLREIELSITKQTERVQAIATYSRQWRHLAGTWQPNDPASIIQPSAFPDDRGIGTQNDTPGGPNQNGLSGTALAEGVGPAAQWRDHVARLAVSYQALWTMTLAANVSFETGPWSGPVVTRLPALDPAFGPAMVPLSNGRLVPNPLATLFRFVGPTRGDGQFTLPNYFVLNLRAGKTIGIAASKVSVAIETFNVTNRGAPLQLLIGGGNQVGNVAYRQGTQFQLPRSVQLSIRATF